MKICECNNTVYPSTAIKLFDSDNKMIDINSNAQISFKLCNDIYLPKNCKIEILETKLNYSVNNIEKEILINGKCINSNNLTLNDCINLSENYINLPKDNCNKILLSIVECLKLDINLILYFRAIAHTEDCRKIYIETVGECEDNIETIFMTKCYCNSGELDFDKSYIELNNNLSSIICPDYIFLSPVFDCQSNIVRLLGNVFINYQLTLDTTCYKKIKKYLYNPSLDFENNYYKEYIHFN